VPTEIDINDGELRLFDISSASTSGVWDRTAEIENGYRHRNISVTDTVEVVYLVYKVLSAQLLAFARLLSF